MKIRLEDHMLKLDTVIEGPPARVEFELRNIYTDALHSVPEHFILGVLKKVQNMQFVVLTILEN